MKQLGLDGDEIPVGDVPAGRAQPIVQLCRKPIETRKSAAMGLPVPCHRCTAARDTPSGCHFIDRLGDTPSP